VDNFQDQKDNLRGEDASNKKVEGVQGLRIPKNLQKALTNPTQTNLTPYTSEYIEPFPHSTTVTNYAGINEYPYGRRP
jgi:hypothetical protein